MRKGNKESIISIKKRLLKVLDEYKELIDSDCNRSCKDCPLSVAIVKKMPLPYEYSNFKIDGEVTTCDLLGLLLIKGKDVLLP